MNTDTALLLVQAGEAETTLPVTATAAVVLAASLLITLGWLAYLYR